MIRINLLPHREERRKARRQQFYSLCGLIVVLAAMLVFLAYSIVGGYITEQDSTNAFLKKEIAALDAQIDQIKRLREQTQALLARKQIIESLQQDRAEAVHLFNELARSVPEGVYLKAIKQTGQTVNLNGYAQSNSRVSSLMRNLDSSEWMENSQLLEIKAVTVDKRRLNEFTLTVHLTRSKTAVGKSGETKPLKDKK